MKVIQRFGSAFDGVFLAASAIAEGNEQELFKYADGEQQNGYTTANGFSAGKPKDVTSGLIKKMGSNERRVIQAIAVHTFPAHSGRALEDVQNFLRFTHLFLNFDHEGKHELGPCLHWPGGAGVADSNLVVASVSNTQAIANNGQPGSAGGVRNVRALPTPIILEAEEAFEVVAKTMRGWTPNGTLEFQVELLGHLEVVSKAG